MILLAEWNFNPFVPNAPFLYPLKTSENYTMVERGCTGNECVKQTSYISYLVFHEKFRHGVHLQRVYKKSMHGQCNTDDVIRFSEGLAEVRSSS